ncbi:MAG TPA: hypothetical protein VMT24_08340 [Aggregatilineaceae bacterium]|nr:hypothetical protein [Aggregatilineaceae bacterium]
MTKRIMLLLFVLSAFLLVVPARADENPQKWRINDIVVIRDGIPFAWLRDIPSSLGIPLYTVYPRANQLRILSGVPGFDGVQYWWYVGDTNRPTAKGWVEQRSLQSLSPATVVPPNQQFPSGRARIRAGVPFVWLRTFPYSYAPAIYTLYPDPSHNPATCLVLGSGTAPYWDGVQWWRSLQTPTGSASGWAEERSLENCGAPVPTPTLVPSPTPTVPIPTVVSSGQSYKIRVGVRFVWLRSAASSYAPVLYTVYPSQVSDPGTCLVGRSSIQARWDGTQWWRNVMTSNGIASGWVEDGSLDVCTGRVPTIVPSPTPVATFTSWAAYEPFERGFMVWRQDTQRVYVFYTGTYWPFDEVTYKNWPTPTDNPPYNRFTPINAFGKVWKALMNGTAGQPSIGWATAQEMGYTATFQQFKNDCYAKCLSYFYLTLPDGRLLYVNDTPFVWSWVSP